MPPVIFATFFILLTAALIHLTKSESHLRVWVRFDGKLSLRVELYLFGGLLLFDYLITAGKISTLSPRERKLLRAINSQKNAAPVPFSHLRPLLKNMRAAWTLNITAGTDDAAATALIAGALSSALKAAALASLRLIPRQTQKLSVTPASSPSVKIDFSCMISIKTGHIIIMAVQVAAKILFNFVKNSGGISNEQQH